MSAISNALCVLQLFTVIQKEVQNLHDA